MALWIVAGLVFSEGINLSSAALTDAVLDARNVSRINGHDVVVDESCFDADMRMSF